MYLVCHAHTATHTQPPSTSSRNPHLQNAHTQARVVMVYGVQRHGARNVLPKTADLKESASVGGPTLLPEGQRQAYAAGTGYTGRYLNGSTCAANGTCLGGAGMPAANGPNM